MGLGEKRLSTTTSTPNKPLLQARTQPTTSPSAAAHTSDTKHHTMLRRIIKNTGQYHAMKFGEERKNSEDHKEIR